MLVLFQVNLYIWASNNYIFIINTMKRRDFLTNTALLGAGIPLGMSSAVMTSCTQQQSAGTAAKSYSPEELGMFSFVEVAPDGKPLKAALVGCGDRGTGLHNSSNQDRMCLSLLWLICSRIEWRPAGKYCLNNLKMKFLMPIVS